MYIPNLHILILRSSWAWNSAVLLVLLHQRRDGLAHGILVWLRGHRWRLRWTHRIRRPAGACRHCGLEAALHHRGGPSITSTSIHIWFTDNLVCFCDLGSAGDLARLRVLLPPACTPGVDELPDRGRAEDSRGAHEPLGQWGHRGRCPEGPHQSGVVGLESEHSHLCSTI